MPDNTHIAVDLPLKDIRAYCKTQAIQRLALFGSVLRDDFGADSDIDMLVTYDPAAPITLLDMAQQEIDLSEIIGRKVDLRTPNELSPFFRDDVLSEAVVIYTGSHTPVNNTDESS